MELSWWSGIDPEIQGEAESLMAQLRAHDVATAERAGPISELAYEIARDSAIAPDRCIRIALAAYLHDIGKLQISPGMLSWPGELDDVQRDVMADHVSVGEVLPASIEDFLQDDISGLTDHHETFLGDGYPAGIPDINPTSTAQIVGIASAYVAMVSVVPYREEALTSDEALGVLRSEAAYAWNPKVVAMLEGVLASYKIDSVEAVTKQASISRKQFVTVDRLRQFALGAVAVVSVVSIAFGARVLVDNQKSKDENLAVATSHDAALGTPQSTDRDSVASILGLEGKGKKEKSSNGPTSFSELLPQPTSVTQVGHKTTSTTSGRTPTSRSTPTTKGTPTTNTSKPTNTTRKPPSSSPTTATTKVASPTPPPGYALVKVSQKCNIWINYAETTSKQYGLSSTSYIWIRGPSDCSTIRTRVHILPWGSNPYFVDSGARARGNASTATTKAGGLGRGDYFYSYIRQTNGTCSQFKSTIRRDGSGKPAGFTTVYNSASCP